MDPSNNSSSSNKIRQIVRLQQLLKKWKKVAAASPSSTHLRRTDSNNNNSSSTKSINKFLKKTLSFTEKDISDASNNSSSTKSINKFLKKTLSFSDISGMVMSDMNAAVPKGCLAVCVGKQDQEATKRFVIPMDYLGHKSFQELLREAEEEFGFQQQGVLKIPCQVSVFENILKTIPTKRPPPHNNNNNNNVNVVVGCCSPDNHQQQHHQGIIPPQLCN